MVAGADYTSLSSIQVTQYVGPIDSIDFTNDERNYYSTSCNMGTNNMINSGYFNSKHLLTCRWSNVETNTNTNTFRRPHSLDVSVVPHYEMNKEPRIF